MDQHPMAISEQDPRRRKPDAIGGTRNADDGHGRHLLPSQVLPTTRWTLEASDEVPLTLCHVGRLPTADGVAQWIWSGEEQAPVESPWEEHGSGGEQQSEPYAFSCWKVCAGTAPCQRSGDGVHDDGRGQPLQGEPRQGSAGDDGPGVW